MKLIEAIAQALASRNNCLESGNTQTEAVWTEVLRRLERALPSGSGINAGTMIERASLPDCVILHTSFHHMNQHGVYDGWTTHRITVKPSFVYGLDLRISGGNRNEIKDYLHQVYEQALSAPVPEHCSYLAAKEAIHG